MGADRCDRRLRDAHAITDADGNGYGDRHSHGHVYAYPYGHGHGHSYSNSNSNSNSNSYANSDTETDTYAEACYNAEASSHARTPPVTFIRLLRRGTWRWNRR
jgi:hypothetical protein